MQGTIQPDFATLAAYLQSLPPVANPVPAPVVPGADAPAPFYRVILPNG